METALFPAGERREEAVSASAGADGEATDIFWK